MNLGATAPVFDGWAEKFITYGFDDWPKPKPRTRMLRDWAHAALTIAR